MDRIYRVWFVRRILPILIVETGILGYFAYQIHEYVGIRNIVRNVQPMLTNAGALINYFLHAVLNTETAVYYFSAFAFVIGFLFMRRVIKSVRVRTMLRSGPSFQRVRFY